jgi:hypothetical protein
MLVMVPASVELRRKFAPAHLSTHNAFIEMIDALHASMQS